MTRTFLIQSTAIATLITAPLALSAETSAGDLTGNSPRILDGGMANDAGSINRTSDMATKRPGIGISEADPMPTPMSTEEYVALSQAVGADFKTSDDVLLGSVKAVTVDAQGNPELVVDMLDDAKIDADTLVLTLLSDSVTLDDNAILIDTTADELYLQAQSGSKHDDETRTTVVVM